MIDACLNFILRDRVLQTSRSETMPRSIFSPLGESMEINSSKVFSSFSPSATIKELAVPRASKLQKSRGICSAFRPGEFG